MSENYPRLRSAAAWLGKAVCLGLAFGVWGGYQQRRGFHDGVDAAICAMRVGLETGEVPRTLSLMDCRARAR